MLPLHILHTMYHKHTHICGTHIFQGKSNCTHPIYPFSFECNYVKVRPRREIEFPTCSPCPWTDIHTHTRDNKGLPLHRKWWSPRARHLPTCPSKSCALQSNWVPVSRTCPLQSDDSEDNHVTFTPSPDSERRAHASLSLRAQLQSCLDPHFKGHSPRV